MKLHTRSAALCLDTNCGRVARRMGDSAFLAAAAIGFFAVAPLTAQAQTSQTQPSPSTSTQSPSTQSSMGQSSTGQTSMSQPAAGQTSTGQSTMGQSTTGQTMTGQSTMGQSTTGQTMTGQSGATQVSGRDTLYDARTAPKGACQGMDWHVVVHPDKTVNGVVSWDGSKHMAHLTGNLDSSGAFKANAVETGSNKSDMVSGTVHGNDLKASISGTGTPCDNETINLPKVTNGVSRG